MTTEKRVKKVNITITPPDMSANGLNSEEAAMGIYQMLRDGRRYFGSSGASLTWQAGNKKFAERAGIDRGSAKVGLAGERDTTTILKKWIKDKPSAVLVDSVHIVGAGKEEVDEETGMIEGGDTDHVIIVGDKVLTIDTKRWKTKSNYRLDGPMVVKRNNRNFPGGNVSVVQAKGMWEKYLGFYIIPIVFINTENVTVFRDRNWFRSPWRLVELDKFHEFMDKWYEEHVPESNKTTINSTIVAQIALNAVKPYDARKEVLQLDDFES